jgi:hypothetical protein
MLATTLPGAGQERGSIAGSVRSADGIPIAGAQISIAG